MLKLHVGKFFESFNLLFIDLLKFLIWVFLYLPKLRMRFRLVGRILSWCYKKKEPKIWYFWLLGLAYYMIRRSGPPTSDLRCPNIEPEGITLTLTLACAAQKYQIFGSKKFRTQNIKIRTQ